MPTFTIDDQVFTVPPVPKSWTMAPRANTPTRATADLALVDATPTRPSTPPTPALRTTPLYHQQQLKAALVRTALSLGPNSLQFGKYQSKEMSSGTDVEGILELRPWIETVASSTAGLRVGISHCQEVFGRLLGEHPELDSLDLALPVKAKLATNRLVTLLYHYRRVHDNGDFLVSKPTRMDAALWEQYVEMIKAIHGLCGTEVPQAVVSRVTAPLPAPPPARKRLVRHESAASSVYGPPSGGSTAASPPPSAAASPRPARRLKRKVSAASAASSRFGPPSSLMTSDEEDVPPSVPPLPALADALGRAEVKRLKQDAAAAASTPLPAHRGALKKAAKAASRPSRRKELEVADTPFAGRIKLQPAKNTHYILQYNAVTGKWPLFVECTKANRAEVLPQLRVDMHISAAQFLSFSVSKRYTCSCEIEVIGEIWAQLKKGKLTSKEQAVALRNKLQCDDPVRKKPAAVGLSCATYLFRRRSLLMFA